MRREISSARYGRELAAVSRLLLRLLDRVSAQRTECLMDALSSDASHFPHSGATVTSGIFDNCQGVFQTNVKICYDGNTSPWLRSM